MADKCTHEITEWGVCAGCGEVIEREHDGEPFSIHPSRITGCMGRGWFHDGSEQEDAFRTRRPARPCPSCTKEKRDG